MRSLMTPGEVAAFLRVSRRSIADRRYLQRLGLVPMRIGGAIRFRPEDVEALVKRSNRDGASSKK